MPLLVVHRTPHSTYIWSRYTWPHLSKRTPQEWWNGALAYAKLFETHAEALEAIKTIGPHAEIAEATPAILEAIKQERQALECSPNGKVRRISNPIGRPNLQRDGLPRSEGQALEARRKAYRAKDKERKSRWKERQKKSQEK